MGKKERKRGRGLWENFPLESFVRITFPFPWIQLLIKTRIIAPRKAKVNLSDGQTKEDSAFDIIFSMASKSINIPGLELVLNYTGKSCIASYYRQFSTNIKTNINFIRPGSTGLFL